MNGNMRNTTVGRIALTGALRGSALITEENGGTRVVLSVRGDIAGASLFTAGEGGIRRTELEASEAFVRQTGVCAAVLAKKGRLLTGGFTGDCAGEKARILSEIRIRAAEYAEGENGMRSVRPEKTKDAPKRGPSGRAGKGADKKPEASSLRPAAGSPVTLGILERAEALFSLLRTAEEAAAPGKEKEPEPRADEGWRTVPNPFPRTFPGSVWREKPEDHRLFGETERGGKRVKLIAVPLGRRGRIPPNAVTARDGRRYVIGESAD